jgi:hypothetical protein
MKKESNPFPKGIKRPPPPPNPPKVSSGANTYYLYSEVLAIIDKYGSWERYMRNGRWTKQKVISIQSYTKMMKEIINYLLNK